MSSLSIVNANLLNLYLDLKIHGRHGIFLIHGCLNVFLISLNETVVLTEFLKGKTLEVVFIHFSPYFPLSKITRKFCKCSHQISCMFTSLSSSLVLYKSNPLVEPLPQFLIPPSPSPAATSHVFCILNW